MGTNNNSAQQRADDTMRSRLGEAVDLIQDHRFLRMFRRCQIDYEELFAFSVKLAKKKDKPSNYFAKIWSPKERSKTVQWLTKMLNQQKNKLAELKRATTQKLEDIRARKEFNPDGFSKLQSLKKSFNMLS